MYEIAQWLSEPSHLVDWKRPLRPGFQKKSGTARRAIPTLIWKPLARPLKSNAMFTNARLSQRSGSSVGCSVFCQSPRLVGFILGRRTGAPGTSDSARATVVNLNARLAGVVGHHHRVCTGAALAGCVGASILFGLASFWALREVRDADPHARPAITVPCSGSSLSSRRCNIIWSPSQWYGLVRDPHPGVCLPVHPDADGAHRRLRNISSNAPRVRNGA